MLAEAQLTLNVGWGGREGYTEIVVEDRGGREGVEEWGYTGSRGDSREGEDGGGRGGGREDGCGGYTGDGGIAGREGGGEERTGMGVHTQQKNLIKILRSYVRSYKFIKILQERIVFSTRSY